MIKITKKKANYNNKLKSKIILLEIQLHLLCKLIFKNKLPICNFSIGKL